ncbi:family 43 glycosylhydrolase [uncultured Fibrobacter sp.]|uniref:family 43 glycosylhydrolase n=1 Tax=uncultured Fibrobacter sp. TaxID=261512 RepID=UPI0025EC4BFF|nr:family 43 glycosylhydrolase [uncultured Fibrobacter sp.]
MKLGVIKSVIATAAITIMGLGTSVQAQTIQNDVFWKDTGGNFIYSQGGGVLQVGDTFYWYGVKYNGAVTYAASPTKKNSDTGFAGVTCYSSKDLVNWKFEGIVLKPDQAAGGWFGRIGVVYNAKTKKYVLAGQGGSPSWQFGEYFATSSSPTGPFKFARVQPESEMTFFVNNNTGDQTLFQDDDGKAYVIASNVKGRTNLYVAPLRESDFLAIDGSKTVNIHKSRVGGREGNAMFKYNGVYYFCSSDLHGWNTSQTYCMSAKNILGPYSEEFVLEGTQHDFSHVTQTGFFIQVKGTKGSFVVNAGDRWSDFAGNGLGYNQWLPISFETGKPVFHSLSQWIINAKEGTWSVGDGNNYCLNPTFEADRVSQTSLTGWKLAKTSSANINSTSKKRTGRWGLYLTGSNSISQTLTVPNGKYKLSAYVQSSGGQKSAKIFAKDFGANEVNADISAASSSWKQKSVAEFEVKNGKVTIGFAIEGGSDKWIAIDDIELVKTSKSAATPITDPIPVTPVEPPKDMDVVSKDSVVYEAEKGFIAEGVTETTHAGFSGESYVNLDNSKSSYLKIAVWNSEAGKRNLKVTYANGGKNARPISVSVNDTVQPESLDLDVTGEWSNWKSKEFSLTLPAGKNIITFKSLTDEGAPNIDKVEFVKNEENKDSSDVKPQEETIGIAQRITPRHDVNIRGNSRYFYVNGKSMNTQHHKASKIRVYSK